MTVSGGRGHSFSSRALRAYVAGADEVRLTLADLSDRPRPSGVRLGAEAAKGQAADQMTLDVEGVVDRGVDGEESLG